jgi:hypothetical protein
MKIKKIILSLATLVAMAIIVSSAYASCGCGCLPGLSPGYWKHNVKAYNGGPGSYSAPFPGYPHETGTSMELYAAQIIAWTPWMAGWTPQQFLIWANGIFQNNSYKDLWLGLANSFNAAAGYQPYSD